MHSTHTVQRLRRVTFLVLACFVLLQASCFNEPDVYTVGTEVTAEGTVIQKPRLISPARLREENRAPGPRVHVEAPVHDFGRLDPLTTHKHTFVIRNVGDQSLELVEGPTTCKCTVASLTNGLVPPGEKALVVMQWNTGRDVTYAHSATIYTNDPRNRVVQLKLKGEVRTLLRCTAEQIVFTRVLPGETASASTIVYSQMWDDFELSQVEAGSLGVTHSIEKATEQELQELKANAALRLTFTLPDNLPEGYFSVPVHVAARRITQGDEEESSTATDASCDLMIEGKVLRRLCVYGPDIDVQGTIMMGRVTQGQNKSVKLLVKVRDEVRDLRVTKSETLPPSLQVRLERYATSGSSDAGLYHLFVEVPKDAPTFRLPPDKHGSVHLEFDHPRITDLDLPVDLIVAPRENVER